jgi:hypothetical protein
LFYVTVHGLAPDLAAVGPKLDPCDAADGRQARLRWLVSE